MSEMTARERIAEAIYQHNSMSDGWMNNDEPYSGYKESLREHYRGVADAAIAIVREALLSSDALYAATYPLSLGSRDVYAREMAGRVVTAALDAAFGADEDGGES